MLTKKVMDLVAENRSSEALDLLIGFFGASRQELVKDFVQLKAQFVEIREEKQFNTSDPAEYKLVHSRIKNAILQILPKDEQVFAIEPQLLESLQRNKTRCRESNTYFYTIWSLLSILQHPNSQVYKCMEQYESGSFDRFYTAIKDYLENKIIQNPNRQPFAEFAWHDRDEFKNTMDICLQMNDPVIDDKKLWMGITAGASTTQQLVARFFDLEKLGRIIQATNSFITP
ncbi:MAG: hypothetical protein JNM22_21335 [Saprospiraceae bacterium]|nr:hypothetical protein [Saprospiraceae bacterium]